MLSLRRGACASLCHTATVDLQESLTQAASQKPIALTTPPSVLWASLLINPRGVLAAFRGLESASSR